MPDRTDYRRAPHVLWRPGAEALQAVEVGAVAVVRLPIKPPPSRYVNDWSHDAEIGEIVMYRDWPCRLVESRGKWKAAAGELTPQRLRAPAKVGDRLWVPETWAWEWGWTTGPAETWWRRVGVGTESPWQLPRRDARLFVSVESVGVEPWCETCGGTWLVPCDGPEPGERAVEMCPDCEADPPLAWCITLRRESVAD